jgi:putative restriction endonuclease
MCWDLSEHIWGEQRFPILILLRGELIDYAWAEFCSNFDFATNYHMRGNTVRLAEDRLLGSRFGAEETFIAALLATKGVHAGDLERDFQEFGNNLVVHLRLVRARGRQREFRTAVLTAQGGRCALCGLDVPVALEAAHVVPKDNDGTDDPRNGLALCAVHHRMFDAHLFGIEPASLRVVVRSPLSPDQLRISCNSIVHLPQRPHAKALTWRWQRFVGPDGV